MPVPAGHWMNVNKDSGVMGLPAAARSCDSTFCRRCRIESAAPLSPAHHAHTSGSCAGLSLGLIRMWPEPVHAGKAKALFVPRWHPVGEVCWTVVTLVPTQDCSRGVDSCRGHLAYECPGAGQRRC